jgi:hypothetical protein
MPEPEEVAVQRFDAGGSELAIFEFQGELRDLVLSSLKTNYLTTGSYVEGGKAVSPQAVLSMASVGGSAAATLGSAAFSSTLFMATAAPSTLMNLGGGVGSAVMGVHGIVGQAAFLPVAASLPVVAPIMAVMALNTVITLSQFKQVNRKLDSIKGTLDKAMARTEATYAAELVAAADIVEEVYKQYELAGSFSNDMLIRLALAEHDVRKLAERSRVLVDTHSPAEIDDLADIQRANYDVHSAMLASFLDLRVAYLRVCVDAQENPTAGAHSVAQLKSKIEGDVEFWQKLIHRSQAIRDGITAREKSLTEMNPVERFMPGGRGVTAERKLATLKQAYVSTLESESAVMDGFHTLIDSAKQTLDQLNKPKQDQATSPTLVYWKDEQGEHSFYTDKLRLS